LEDLLPHINASLNGLATVLLIVGYVFIKQRRELAHKRTMLACFGVSVIFLGCYLLYHYQIGGGKRFPTEITPTIRYSYYFVLLTHIVLAAITPFLAVATIYLGLRERRAAHRRIAKITFPIWLYVSITGVVVYGMLYHLAPALIE